MRATMRITCLLLSLSFLFHSVCANGDSQTATSVTKNDAAVMPGPPTVPTGGGASVTETTIDSKIGVNVGGTGGAPPTTDSSKKNELTQAPTPAKPMAVVTMPKLNTDPTTTAASKPTDKPAPTQPQAPTVPNNPPASTTVNNAANSTVRIDATPVATTPSQPKIPSSATTVASSGGSVASPSVATLQTPVATVPSKNSGTPAPVNEGTTNLSKVSTAAPLSGQQSLTHTTITTKTSQDSKGGTERTTVTVTSHKQTASRAPEPAGNTGNITTPSTLTKAGPPAAETSGTQAGTSSMSPQTTTTTITTTTKADQPKMFMYSLNNGQEKEEEKDLVEVCRRLMVNLYDGNCTLTWQHRNGKIQFDCVEINGKVKTSLAAQYYEEITKKPTDNKTLIAILASCGALLIMIVILAVCASHHRKPYNENQQHLTEELHTVENGYHDNPTLEVMEVQPEMQEKKVALNGEFNDSWIVPIDNLLKEDIPDEEDTHL